MKKHPSPPQKDVILVVDDQPSNLKVAASVLSAEYTLSITNSGLNALKFLETEKPDLILLDVMMPEMDGYEVCRRIKQNPATSQIPVIFLTAKTEVEDIIRGFEEGAVDYISKPFNPTEMKVRVRNHLNLSHAGNELRRINGELRESEEKLKQLNQKLEQSNREKDKFFSIIAHDLRTPFNGIMGFSEMLRDELSMLDPEIISEYAGYIYSSSRTTFELLENLLQWARMQQGNVAFRPVPLNLNRLALKEMQTNRLSATNKAIGLTLQVPENLITIGDENMLGAVLRNLISNAIKFTHRNGQVSVTALQTSTGVEVMVEDTGVGIPPDKLGKLFRIETSFSTEGTEEEKGSGLGLMLCQDYLAMHGGGIRVESETGKGSRFIFWIPSALPNH